MGIERAWSQKVKFYRRMCGMVVERVKDWSYGQGWVIKRALAQAC